MNTKSISIKLIFLSMLLMMMAHSAYSERLKVHPSEQVAMDALIKRIGVNEDDITSGGSKRQLEEYDEYFQTGIRYFHEPNAITDPDISVITNENGYVSRLRVYDANLTDVKEISSFKSLKILELKRNNLTSLKNISKLNELVRLNIIGNHDLHELSDIRDMPNLVEIKAITLDSVNLNGMTNLPKLKRFLCDSCEVSNISPLRQFPSLKVIKMEMNGKTFESLKGLTNLEELVVKSPNLIDISALNSLKSLRKVDIHRAAITDLPLSPSLVNLEELRVGDAPIKALPNLSKFSKLKTISFFGTEIESVDSINSLDYLEEVRLSRNVKMKKVVNLVNLPKLEKLSIRYGPLETFETGPLPSLQKLNLSDTNISELKNFEYYPQLRELNIMGTKVKSLKGIEKAKSLFRVSNDYELMDDPENVEVLDALRENFLKKYN